MIEKIRKIKITDPFILDNYYGDTILDIETTGLSREYDNIFLIGTIDIYPETEIKILTAEKLSEEYDLIKSLNIKNKVITYNGDNFDLKFINNKLKGFNEDIIDFKSFDLYKFVKNNKSLLKLNRHRQVDIETFLGINREEFISGGEVASNYKDFLISRDYDLINPIITHNLDDVHGLLKCLKIVEYTNKMLSFSFDEHSFIIENLSFSNEFMEVSGNSNIEKDYYFENFNYRIEIINKIFNLKCSIHENYYNDYQKCKYVLKNENSSIKNMAKIPSPDTVQILYLNEPIYENIKSLTEYLFKNLIKKSV